MENNNLDKFFAEKLSQRKFEFNPAHWEAAEKLIELQEQNDRGKRFGWLLLLIPLLALVGCLCYFAKANYKADGTGTSTMTHSGMTSALNFIDNNTADASIKTTEKNNSTQANKTKTTVTELSTASTTEQVEMKNATESAYPKSMNSRFPTTQENNNTTVIETPATVKASSDVETITEKGYLNAASSELNRAELKLITPDTTSQNIKQSSTPKRDQASITPVQPTIDLIKKPMLSTPDEAVAILNTTNTTLDVPVLFASIDEVPSEEKGVIIKEDRKKKIDVGLMAGTLFYSSKREAYEGLDSTKSSNGAYQVGFTGGLTAGFRFSDHFSIHADALYQWRKENLGVIGTTRSEAYSFGLVSKTVETHPQSFHSIEIPVYLAYTYGGHSIEAGVSCRHLFAIQGIDKAEATPDLPSENSIEEIREGGLFFDENNVWIPEDKYERFSASYMVGYRYWFNDRFNLGFRATYTPSAKPFSSNADNFTLEDSQTFATQTSSLNFGVSAKYYFNKRSNYKKI